MNICSCFIIKLVIFFISYNFKCPKKGVGTQISVEDIICLKIHLINDILAYISMSYRGVFNEKILNFIFTFNFLVEMYPLLELNILTFTSCKNLVNFFNINYFKCPKEGVGTKMLFLKNYFFVLFLLNNRQWIEEKNYLYFSKMSGALQGGSLIFSGIYSLKKLNYVL